MARIGEVVEGPYTRCETIGEDGNVLRVPTCNGCQVLVINGVACHETGCEYADWNPITGERYERECKNCGCPFTPDNDYDTVCDEDCFLSYYGI